MDPTLPKTESQPPRRAPLFLVGVLIFFLGPVLYGVQLFRAQLLTPWHVPILATIGVLFMAVSLGQRRGILRAVGLLVFLTLCVLVWLLVGVMIRTPEYTGPASPGQKIPAFAATRAHGGAFSHSDLTAGAPSIMLFFRGKW